MPDIMHIVLSPDVLHLNTARAMSYSQHRRLTSLLISSCAPPPHAGATNATVPADKATLEQFVHLISGGVPGPTLPPAAYEFLNGADFDPALLPNTIETSCDSVAGAWVQGNVRINTAMAFMTTQNLTASLDGAGRATTQVGAGAGAGAGTGVGAGAWQEAAVQKLLKPC